MSQPPEHRIGELEAALLKWKCGSCGGCGLYLNRTRDGAQQVACKVCNGQGLNPIAQAVLKPIMPEYHHGGLWDGQDKLDWFLDTARRMATRAGSLAVLYSNLRAANIVAEDMAHVEGRVFSPLPEHWFTYAGDGYARSSGIPTTASFLWPSRRRAIQEQRARTAEDRRLMTEKLVQGRAARDAESWHVLEGRVPPTPSLVWRVRFKDGTEEAVTQDFDWFADRGENPVTHYFDDIPF